MLENISLWSLACQELNINFEIVNRYESLLKIKLGPNKNYYIANYTLPFNSSSMAEICTDKEYTYQILKNVIAMPKTSAFVDPCGDYRQYVNCPNIKSIVEEIRNYFNWPLIIKRNRGWGGKNVFLCQDVGEVELSLKKIFDKNSKEYDLVALAQEYIDIAKEYRAVFFKRKLLLLYEKNKDGAEYVGNLSPLHWENSQAVHITDAKLMAEIQNFIEPIFQQIPLNYAGVDVALDRLGKYWLIELNCQPAFSRFIQDNGEEKVINMLKYILQNCD